MRRGPAAQPMALAARGDGDELVLLATDGSALTLNAMLNLHALSYMMPEARHTELMGSMGRCFAPRLPRGLAARLGKLLSLSARVLYDFHCDNIFFYARFCVPNFTSNPLYTLETKRRGRRGTVAANRMM